MRDTKIQNRVRELNGRIDGGNFWLSCEPLMGGAWWYAHVGDVLRRHTRQLAGFPSPEEALDAAETVIGPGPVTLADLGVEGIDG